MEPSTIEKYAAETAKLNKYIDELKNQVINGMNNIPTYRSPSFPTNFEYALDELINNYNTDPLDGQLKILCSSIKCHEPLNLKNSFAPSFNKDELDKYAMVNSNVIVPLNNIVRKLHEANKLVGKRIIINEFNTR